MANEKITKALGEKFSFKIANTTGATKVIALLAAFFDTLNFTQTLVEGAPNTETHVMTWKDAAAIVAAGYSCDYVLDDGTLVANLVCSAMNSKKSIRQFRDYIRENPRICVDMTVQATIPAQFNESVEVVKYSPLIGSLSQEINLNLFKSVDQFSTDKVEVKNVNIEMAFDTLMLLPVPTGCTTTITFQFS